MPGNRDFMALFHLIEELNQGDGGIGYVNFKHGIGAVGKLALSFYSRVEPAQRMVGWSSQADLRMGWQCPPYFY
jgi:hypothetical protein